MSILDAADQLGVQCLGISKAYGRTQVLAPTTLNLAAGQVHALVGANGAGKSTLLGILSGRVTPTTGSVRFRGELLDAGKPRRIRHQGVAAVYQELEIVPGLSAMANVFLGTELHRSGMLAQKQMRERFGALCERLKVDIDPGAWAGSLSVAQQQTLEIMRALRSDARLLLFDEPTASLALPERRTLLGVLRALVGNGLTVAFVSHQLDEVLEISDTVTVLRNGEIVAEGPRPEWTKERLIREMAGYRPIDANADLIRDEREPITRGRPTEFRVEGLRLAGRVDDVTITAAPGEVVGLAGLVGSGRSSILRCIAGVESKALGAMTVEQRRARVPRTVRAARRLGIVLIPEDRKTEGLIGGRSVEDNISLSSYRSVSNLGVVRPRRQRVLSDSWRSRVHLTSHRPGVKARMLSGGNQQKVLLARVLEVRPRIVLADEPTRGVDVAAKEQLLGTLRAFADNGGSVVMTSSEIEEVLSVSDRVYVIHDGRVVKELHDIGPHVSVESVLRLCFGNDDSV